MKRFWNVMALVCMLCIVVGPGSAASEEKRVRFFVVSSYHREYPYSQETNQGLCAAMLKFGYVDNQAQADEYSKNDYVESSTAVIKKVWMDTKRKNSKAEMEAPPFVLRMRSKSSSRICCSRETTTRRITSAINFSIRSCRSCSGGSTTPR